MSIDVMFDSTIPYDLRFFQALDRFVQSEPWQERDKVRSISLRPSASRKASHSIPTLARKKFLTMPHVKRMRGWI